MFVLFQKIKPKFFKPIRSGELNQNDEVITFDQFVEGLTNLHLTISKEKAEEVFDGADSDGDGVIDIIEFAEMLYAFFSVKDLK